MQPYLALITPLSGGHPDQGLPGGGGWSPTTPASATGRSIIRAIRITGSPARRVIPASRSITPVIPTMGSRAMAAAAQPVSCRGPPAVRTKACRFLPASRPQPHRAAR